MAVRKPLKPLKPEKPLKAEQKEIVTQNRQLRAIVFFALGLFLTALALVQGTNMWKWLHDFLYGMFSFGAMLLGPLFIFISIISSMSSPKVSTKGKLWQIIVIVILICSAAHIFVDIKLEGGFAEIIGVIYENGTNLSGGGIVGALLGLPIVALCGRSGAGIIIIILLFTFAMIFTGSTLPGLFRIISKPFKKLTHSYSETARDREDHSWDEEDPYNGSENDFLPQHPVSSPTERSRIDIPLEPESAGNNGTRNTKGAPLDYEDIISRATRPSRAPSKLRKEKYYDNDNGEENEYIFPSTNLLKKSGRSKNSDAGEELRANAARLVDTLKSFGVQTRILDISRGPAVTRYELQPAAGVKVNKITNLADDIALNLAAAAGVRIEPHVPNKSAVGIEVPNKYRETVNLRDMIDSGEFEKSQSKVSVALGKDISGAAQIVDLSGMPHLLIAGTTGSGKSVCINSMIISLLYKSSPDEVRLLMIDPKQVELNVYNGIPHLLVPVVTDPRKAAGALGWAVTEMLKRYRLFADKSVRDIKSYNKLAQQDNELDHLPLIVIIVDELADLMMAAPKEVEDSICRLAQLARAAGMHLVVATQRPSVDVITGLIKANIPSRIALSVSSNVDSRTILDGIGAEKLLGNGDMLFRPIGVNKPVRIQGCFVDDDERDRVIKHIKSKDSSAHYDDEVLDEIDRQAISEKSARRSAADSDESGDDLYDEAVELVVDANEAAASTLQRKLKIGYARAGRLVDMMEQRGIVGEHNGSKPRKVLISRQQWMEMKMNKEE
ncbi:MAG: DNA translocase FtsK [Oscillospiraceae bacterium]|nr:DNA translocase FtsK [Oscillospiraceae bacterium]